MSVNDKKEMEYEKRVMIDENQYHEVKAYIEKRSGFFRVLNIKNLYFDRPDFYIINHEMMLRIREINGIAKEVTLKVKGDNGDQEITRLIKEQVDYNLSIFEQNLLNKEMLKILKENNVNPKEIGLITTLSTERIELIEDNCIYVLDKNYYNGIVDFDIEVEAKSILEAEKYLLDFISLFGIEYKKDYITKSRRAIKSLK